MRENQEAFYRCYRSIEKLTEMPQVFNAQYGLYRSLLTAFVLLMLVAASNSASRLLTGAPVGREHVRALALLTIGTVASYWRAKKRGKISLGRCSMASSRALARVNYGGLMWDF